MLKVFGQSVNLRMSGSNPIFPVGSPIYLDYNATTPVDPVVFDAIKPHLQTVWGNPSSTHFFGQVPKTSIGIARARLKEAVGSRHSGDEIIFTSGKY